MVLKGADGDCISCQSDTGTHNSLHPFFGGIRHNCGVWIAEGLKRARAIFRDQAWHYHTLLTPETASRLDTLWGNVDHLSERSELINISPNYVNVSVANFARIRGVLYRQGSRTSKSHFS